jgi:hypothetical protein
MSLLHQTNTYQGSNEKAGRKHSGYGLVVALICMALALVFAKYSRQQPLVELHSSVLDSVDPS